MQLSRFALLTSSSLAFVALAAGCSSGVEAPFASSGAGASSGAEASSGAGPGSAASSGAGGQFDAGGTVTTIEKDMGPINVQSGVENTQCVIVNLKNAEGAFVRRFRAELGTGSHHMIVYTSSQTVEQPVPQDCQPFSGILFGEHPVFIAQQAQSDLVFPDDNGAPVGFEIQPNQMVKLEMHYINTGAGPLDVTGKIFLDTIPLSANVIKSDLAFWGTKNISIPANSTFDTGVKFQAALAGTKAFALTTHQHQLGTEMQVWYAKDASDTSTRVADGTNWSDPPLEIFSPALAFPGSGGQQGFAYECKWNNPTPNTVKFGEGFNNEMCFLWQYYYPSQGFQFCMDGFCKKTP